MNFFELFFDESRLALLLKGQIALLNGVNDQAVNFAEYNGFVLFVFLVKFLIGVITDVFPDFVEFEGISLGQHFGEILLLRFVEHDFKIVHVVQVV